MTSLDIPQVNLTKRRDFLRLAGAATLAGASPLAATSLELERPEVCVYTEHFQELPIPQVCRLFREMGVEGLDLTVRPGGHIAPENAQDELPGAVKQATDQGLRIMMLTTAITAPDSVAEQIVTTCDRLDIRRIKLGYHAVGEFGELSRRLDAVRKSLDSIVALTTKYHVRPCLHLHSGPTIPSNGFMLHRLIEHIPPDQIGAFLDSYHMTMTGGAGGWKQAIDLLRPWVSLVALKNFRWNKGRRDELGQQTWSTDYCRLEDGIAPIPDFIKTVHQAGYRGFYTLHTEYRRPLDDCIQLTRDDFGFVKKVFAEL